MTDLAAAAASVRARLAALGEAGRRRSSLLRRVPPLGTLIELAARVGYGARGFVYVSIGVVTLLAAFDVVGDAIGSGGVIALLAKQPFGRVWLLMLALGLCAFVLWRVLQSAFDADRAGTGRKALMIRAGQGASAIFYGLLAAAVFEVLDEVEAIPEAADASENRQQAAMLLALPFGNWLLIGAGLVVLAVGVGNILKGLRSDFGQSLSCSAHLCRQLAPVARTGYVARGAAYLPLGAFVILGGLRASAEPVTGFGQALDALERQPGGSWVLAVTACGLIAFGLFAFVEARYRRIRSPGNPLTH